jgi:diguanylate cyclase (GGDEF)-like protein/PAS domain S-box-containing protein
MPDLSQIFESINVGLVVLDRDLKVTYWNRWMAERSGLAPEAILGTPVFTHFPSLDTPKFMRSVRAVLAFGTFAYFSQKLHKHLFPFRPVGSLAQRIPFMQQSCTMGPLRDEQGTIVGVYLSVLDMTELALYEQRLIQMNQQDALTGVFNRRHLETRLREELERSQRYHTPFSVILLDIDHFKRVNDTHGHAAGDGVLVELGRRLGGMVRSTDCFARFGGEEFCCLLPQTPLANAQILAERFRTAIGGKPVAHQDLALEVSISLGVTEASGTDTRKSLMQRVDEALYAAKEAGRNRVVLLPPEA